MWEENPIQTKEMSAKYTQAATWERGTKRSVKAYLPVRAIRRWYGLIEAMSSHPYRYVVIRYRLSYFQDDLNLNDSTCVLRTNYFMSLVHTVSSFAKWKKKKHAIYPHQIIVRIKTVSVRHIHYTLHTVYITHNACLRADFSLLQTFYFY